MPSRSKWKVFLGAAAVVDCICTFVVYTFTTRSSSREIIIKEEFPSPAVQTVVSGIIEWNSFVRNAFHLIWFCHAWIVARERAISILRGDELIIIMSRESIKEEETRSGNHAKQEEKRAPSTSKMRAMIGFFETLLFHLSLLPMFNSSQSYLFTALLIIYNQFSSVSAAYIHKIKSALLKRIMTWLLSSPFLFYSRVRSILVWIRWSKFFLLLIGSCNKLVGKMKDFMKKWKQYKDRKRSKRSRKKLFNVMTTEQRRDKAARQIQSVFRSKQKCRQYAVLLHNKLQKEEDAAIRIQNRFRCKIAESKLRLMKKQKELEKLKQQQILTMTAKERMHLMELQKEINSCYYQRKANFLLIRPNQKFSVIWQGLFVSCIIIEIILIVFAPLLTGNTEKMTLEEFLALVLYQSISLFHSPNDALIEQPNSDNLSQQHPIFQMLHAATVTFVATSLLQQPIGPDSDSNDDIVSSSLLQNIIMICIPILVHIYNFICFWNVPIAFFTGELHPITGLIVPKSFITRWILPGLLLELLANPAMENVYSVAKDAAFMVFFELDPGRVLCWILAFVYPLWTWYFYRVVLDYPV